MRNEFEKSNVGKGNKGGGGSGLPRLAATMLGLSRNFAYELVNRGELPVIIFGKRKLIPRAALEKMLEKVG